MSLLSLVGVLWWILLVGAGLVIWLFIEKGFLQENRIKKSVARHVGFTLFAVLLVSPFYYEFPATGFSVPVTFVPEGQDDFRIVQHPFGVFHHPFTECVVDMPLVETELYPLRRWGETIKFGNGFTRTICFEIVPKFADPRRFYRFHERRQGDYGDSDPVLVVQKLISEKTREDFVKSHLAELKEFSDDRDSLQQAKFQALTCEYFAPILKTEGFDLSRATFSID